MEIERQTEIEKVGVRDRETDRQRGVEGVQIERLTDRDRGGGSGNRESDRDREGGRER